MCVWRGGGTKIEKGGSKEQDLNQVKVRKGDEDEIRLTAQSQT